MEPMEFFNVLGNMLATGSVTPADILLGLASWATVGFFLLALGSTLSHLPFARERAANGSASRKRIFRRAA